MNTSSSFKPDFTDSGQQTCLLGPPSSLEKSLLGDKMNEGSKTRKDKKWERMSDGRYKCTLCPFTSAYHRNFDRHHRRRHNKLNNPPQDEPIDLSSSRLRRHTTTTFCPDGVSEDEMSPATAVLTQQHQDVSWLHANVAGVQTSPPPAEDYLFEDRKYSVPSSGTEMSQKCLHCGVDFADVILYTVHMGCHGYQHPFQCNVCGYVCKDKYEFACHFAHGQHVHQHSM